MNETHELLTRLTNEYATIQLELDTKDANGPRILVKSLRDHREVYLDPLALALVCHIDAHVLDLLAEISRDESARADLANWLEARNASVVVPDRLPPDPAG
jgi:hypothetical protein